MAGKSIVSVMAFVGLPASEQARLFVDINAEQRKVKQSDRYRPVLKTTTRRTAEGVEIRIKDNGIGIPPSVMQKIFNPFFTTTSGGTGLGLPAVRRIARAHGGRVEAVSTVGKGSTFRIHLPVESSGPI